MERRETSDAVEVVLPHFDIAEEENARVVAGQMLELVKSVGTRQLTLSFSNVEACPDFMIATLISLYRKVRDSGGKLVLRDMQPQVYELFETCRLDKVFDIRRSDL